MTRLFTLAAFITLVGFTNANVLKSNFPAQEQQSDRSEEPAPQVAWRGTAVDLYSTNSLPLVGKWIEVEGQMQANSVLTDISDVMLDAGDGSIYCLCDSILAVNGRITLRGQLVAGAQPGSGGDISLMHCQLIP
jgi:hypothetical protein